MEQLSDTDAAIDYLQVTLEEYQMDGDTSFFLSEIRTVVEAQGESPNLPRKLMLSHRYYQTCSPVKSHHGSIHLVPFSGHLGVDYRLNREATQVVAHIVRMRIILLHQTRS